MRTINNYQIMPISKLKINREYQRPIEDARKRKIMLSIDKNGYWPQEVIILNEKFEIIDGQHRVEAAKQLGLSDVPASIVSFQDKKTEAEFFANKNNWNTSLKPIDFWHARYLAEHPYAIILYTLVNDYRSSLYKKVAIKGQESEGSKLYISDALFMINTSALSFNDKWDKNSDVLLTSKIANIDYDQVLCKVNGCADFVFEWISTDKKRNPIPYKSHNLRCIIIFYQLLYDQGMIKDSGGMSKCLSKMKNFVFTPDFTIMNHASKIIALVSWYNLKKKSKRLEYNPN